MAYTVTVAGSSATVSLTKSGGISVASAQTLINGIQYQNTNTDNPTPGVRVFDISSITDSGDAGSATSNFAPGTNSSSVLVTPVNDPPAFLSSTASSTLNTTNSQAAGNAINIPVNGFVIKDPDAGSSLEKLTFTMTETTASPITYATLIFNFPVDASSMYSTKTSDNTYTVYGTVADLNSWLQLSNAISYSPKLGFAGTATFNPFRLEDTFGAFVTSSIVANVNVAADTQPPMPISVVLSSEATNKIILNFNEPLNTTQANLPLASAFTVDGVAPTGISEVGSSVILTTSNPVNSNMSIRYTDTPGATQAIQDAAGQHAASLTVNAVSDYTAPELTNSMTYYNGVGSALNKFVLNFNEYMSSVTVATGQFSVYIIDPIYPDRTGTSSIANFASGGLSSYGPGTVTFGINNNFLSPSASVSVTYTDPSSANDTNAIQDLAGNDVPNMVLGAWTNDILASNFAAGKNVMVVGGPGNDSMTGGSANDTFIWFAGDAGTSAPGAVDVVKNFTPWNSGTASGDKINISKLLTNNYISNSSTLSQWVTLTANQASPSGTAGSTKIVIDVDGSGPGQVFQTIWLEGVNLSSTDPAVLKTNPVLIA